MWTVNGNQTRPRNLDRQVLRLCHHHHKQPAMWQGWCILLDPKTIYQWMHRNINSRPAWWMPSVPPLYVYEPVSSLPVSGTPLINWLVPVMVAPLAVGAGADCLRRNKKYFFLILLSRLQR
jgi:hypothetical protein